MLGPITYLDAALIALAFISGLLAMYRGFAREMLSIVSWAVAAAAAFYIVIYHKPFAQDMAHQMGAPDWLAQVVVGTVIFLIVLIVVHLITARISDAILDSRIGMIDRILGFLFGVARGFIIIVILYLFYQGFFPDPNQHVQWVRDAKSLPYIKGAGDAIYSVIESYLPSSSTAPPTEPPPEEPQQQGALEKSRSDELALEARVKYHISVAWQVRAS